MWKQKVWCFPTVDIKPPKTLTFIQLFEFSCSLLELLTQCRAHHVNESYVFVIVLFFKYYGTNRGCSFLTKDPETKNKNLRYVEFWGSRYFDLFLETKCAHLVFRKNNVLGMVWFYWYYRRVSTFRSGWEGVGVGESLLWKLSGMLWRRANRVQ